MDDLPALPAPTPGRYRHYKGGEYELIGVARHSETLEPLVLYRPLYGRAALWVRPYSMFFGYVELDGGPQPRFAPMDGASPPAPSTGSPDRRPAPAVARIGPLSASATTIDALGEILVEAVAHGGSLGFLHPLPVEEARAFWAAWLAAAARDERVVLGAWDGPLLVGTVSLLLAMPPNQPHRAEIAKMMMRVGHRGRGVAAALLQAAEAVAVERRRTLLVLDTAVEDGASRLYEKCGFAPTGVIPDFALKPHGGLTGTIIYWKRVGTT